MSLWSFSLSNWSLDLHGFLASTKYLANLLFREAFEVLASAEDSD